MSRWQGVKVDFRVLGPVVAVDGDRVVAAGVTREGLLLADLLVHVGEVVSSARLIEDLWRGNPPAGAAATLPTYVRNLRNLLQPGRVRGGADGLILTRRPGYVLPADAVSIDTDRFEDLAAEGRRALAAGALAAATAKLEAALGLWRGPAYAEVAAEAFAQPEATRLEELRLVVVEARVNADLALGRHPELIGELEALVAEHPFREGIWGQLMVALYRSGRQAEALRAYGQLRRLLKEELGIDPSRALRDLEREILLQHDVGPSPVEAPTTGGRHQDPTGGVAGGPVTARGALTARRQNLPVALTRFVGRASELEEVTAQLAVCRLVTLTGAGGVGKTRLAIQAAATAAEHYPDGVWLLELAPLSEEAAVPSALMSLFGIGQGGLDSLEAVEQAVRDYLAGRRVLLVVDNCEHVVGAVARLVDSVLRACPAVSVLATSRALLGLTGEVALTVPPLSLPPRDRADISELLACDAVALFCDRAKAARPQFRLTPVNARAVTGICRRLDGIPLALELAAARVRMLSVDHIAARLADCFALLSGGAGTGVPRHRTLRSALDWSYDLLTPPEQTALQRLAVFADDFDLDSAAAVLACDGPSGSRSGDGDGFELLASLIDKSLVVVRSAGEELRYRLLEPIRHYAGEKLAEAGETDATRRRHRDFFVSRAQALRRAGLVGLVHGQRDFADQANYRAALEWSWQEGDIAAALDLVHVQMTTWAWSADPRDRQWLERVLAQPEPAEHPARPQLLALLAVMVQDSGQPDPEREEQLMREAAALARRLGDPEVIASVDFGFAELELALGKTAEARTRIEAALAAYERFGSPGSVGWCHDHLGWVEVAEFDYRRAHSHFERAAQLARVEGGDQWLAAHALAALAPLAVLVGDPERGSRLADEAVAAARSLPTPAVLYMSLARAAETAILAGSFRQAGDILGELLGLLRDVRSRRWLADALEMAALVLEFRDHPVTAVEVLGASAALRASSGEKHGGSRALAAEVRRSRDRLGAMLGPDRFANHQARGGKVPPEAVTDQVLARLGTGSFGGPNLEEGALRRRA